MHPAGASVVVGLLVLPFSGCLDNPAPPSPKEAAAPSSREPVFFAGSTGGPDRCDVRGRVWSTTGEPLAGADVVSTPRLRSLGAGVTVLTWVDETTDANGTFAMENMTTTPHRFAARMIGYGYDIQEQSCRAGQTMVLTFVLQPSRPHHVDLEPLQGKIGCAAGLHSTGVGTADFCDESHYNVSKDAKTIFIPETEAADVTGLVMELVWKTPLDGVDDCLSVIYPLRSFGRDPAEVTYATNGYQWFDRSGGYITGGSPLRFEVDSPWQAPAYWFASLGFPFQFWVRGGTTPSPQTDLCQSGPVVEQPFTLYITLFYNGEPVPSGYRHPALAS